MGGRKSKWLLLQVSWIRDDGGMEQDCGNWYGKKEDWPEKDQKNRLTGLDLVTGWMGGRGERKKSFIIPRFLNLAIEGMMVPTNHFPSVGNIYKVLKILQCKKIF